MPVLIAAEGIPKNWEVFSSWAITVPPIFLIAVTPIAPSLPVPVSTTAIARSLELAATDSNSELPTLTLRYSVGFPIHWGLPQHP